MREYPYTSEVVESVDAGLRRYMQRIYAYMGIGLALTGAMAFLVSHSITLLTLFLGTPLRWVVLLAPLGIVMFLSVRLPHLSFTAAQATFWSYAAMMGISLSSIFLVYTQESVALTFFVTASTFLAMSLYGYVTQKSLIGMGAFLMMGVWGLVIASLVNMLFQSSAFQFCLSALAVVIFSGLTAYDTQEMKHLYYELDSHETSGKKAIWGALRLYLDFINIFVSLLNVLGDRRS
ncbi:MAG: Bax inhibitor-1/YccA family protein [Holosporales bacterium]|nr:Bax inhibitor-1/YccA family protein [Holosporales bacterium]